MSEIRIPLPNGTQLTFVQKEKPEELQPIITTQHHEPINDTNETRETKDEIPLMVSSVDELQEISLALIYYKTYLKNKGQQDRAEQIGAIDHKVFQTLQSVQATSQ
ncbi:hypothetical protein [uncultured Microscilla sp.]|uniref:hypothetical protein n=1 Tax=uncultured Microscilla sp. TaxID=432653 RepID=UPI00261566AC|nr:hypothetical protein [uncultured Microscilla sp.]